MPGIPQAPRGIPQVEVKFDIDANGILNVSATDKATNKSQQITIQGSANLKQEEIERMKKEAEEHAAEDQKRREKVEHQNLAETMIYTTEKMLKEAGDKVSPDERREVEEKIEALKKVKESDDHEAIKRAADELTAVAQKVGAKMYQEQKTDVGNEKSEKTDQGPIDAEFKEKE